MTKGKNTIYSFVLSMLSWPRGTKYLSPYNHYQHQNKTENLRL